MGRFQPFRFNAQMATQRRPLQPYVKPKIKNPLEDPLIAMSHDRREKELKNDKNRRMCSGVTGAIVHKELDLKRLETDLKALTNGVQEYGDQIKLLEEDKRLLMKRIATNQEWVDVYESSIGPFEAKYEESLQKLIDDFGYHPTFKRWFDEF